MWGDPVVPAVIGETPKRLERSLQFPLPFEEGDVDVTTLALGPVELRLYTSQADI